ncbi:hypothetical protein DBR11_01115 [Pedobacter sp. HMWF019]|uniref:alpha/beta hydrolase n=1 Tax=Pedobacter sp. HMWF019 TaxID=2056856 RepID=UPI000D352D53|nr:alpha/beta fold hydrolase [Pedobacter sp. HMWF019]PTT03883.1 hypothetical protein DBR11_01115 [Pedobacter sp. HMWF019]
MKRLFCVLLLGTITFFARGQNVSDQLVVDKFLRYFNSSQADSLYTLFDPQMQTVLNVEKTKAMINQIKGKLGQIVKSHYEGSPASEIYEYRMSFEKPLVDLALMLKGGMIAGIRQKKIEMAADSATRSKSPDNFVVRVPLARLVGTLTMPKASGKVPVVLLISGSGPTDRNMNQESGLTSNSFLMLAKGLADHGIASVRYDKRGVGRSVFSGNPEDLVFDDFIGDAVLLVDSLKKDARFSKVIIAGHSEGATIGLVAALKRKPAAFISLSGYATDLVSLLGKQLKADLSPADFKVAAEVMDSLKAGKRINKPLPGILSALFSPAIQPFLISNVKYNARLEIAKLKVPILIIAGTHDLQIGVEDAERLHVAALGSKLKLITNMNHVLKNAPAEKTANFATYNKPDLPLHPDLMPILTQFILQLR